MITNKLTWIAALAAVLLLLSGSWSPAQAIVAGTPAPPTVQAHSTVAIGNFCSGTLVAPDLVLTALHCDVGWRLTASALPHPPFRSAFDWERPDRFYPLAFPIPVLVGTQVPPAAAAAPVFTATAIEYAVPGITDIVLLRLQSPVPADKAQPVRIKSSLSAVPDPSLSLNALTFQVAGFGDANDADNVDLNGDGVVNTIDGTFSGSLNLGNANRAQFPCPPSAGWAFPAAYFICVESADGSGTRRGDSGGPLYWTDSVGSRFLLGIYQGIERSNGGRYIAPFYRGGSNYDSLPYPNLGDWLERMVYGREGGTAFLWASDATSDHYASPDYAANPTGRLAHIEREGTGIYRAIFEGLRQTPEREPRVAFVTAYGTDSAYCKLGDASAADSIEVRCLDAAGAPADSRFSLLSDFSNTDLLIRVPRLLLSGSRVAVPSIQGGSTVRRVAEGLYDVETPAWTGGAWKDVIVTAEGWGTARCHADYWASGSARVRCMNHAGTPVDSGFTFGATSGDDSSYAWGSQPTVASYTAPGLYSNIASSSALPTIRRDSVGAYTTSFTGAPRNVGGNVQVTAYGNTTNHCKVASWGLDTAYVRCFDTAGNPADTAFVVRYVDPLDTGRRVTVQLNELRATSSDECGGMDMYGSLRFLAGATGSITVPTVSNADVRRFSTPVSLTARSTPGVRFVDVELDVRDEDDVLCGGDDDLIDIVPHPDVRDLRIRIDLQARTVRMLDSVYPTIGGIGNWTTDGRNGDETGKADFTVVVSEA